MHKMQTKAALCSVLVIQLMTLAAIIFNIAFARQLFGFLFVAFIPGFLILRIVKLDNLRIYLNILLSVGLSITFMMFLGLLLNALFPVFGLQNPLSTFPIVVSTSSFVLVSCALLSRRSEPFLSLPMPRPKLFLPIVFLVSIPFVTVIGTEIARTTGNTLVLMLLVILTSLVVLSAFWNKLISAEIYPLAILAIALFLLFHVSLISSYNMGADIHREAYFAQTTFINSFWNRSLSFNPYNAMLSVTVLPTIFANFLNVDITWVFKIAYPLIYSLVPLILYFAYRKQTGSLVAFLSVFFFMSMDTFYVQMLGLARQMIAELFLALLILLIADEKMGIVKKKLMLVIFSIALLWSHYAVAYLFLFLALVTFSISEYFKGTGKTTVRLITGKFIFGYALATSAWYIFVVPAASKTFADALGYIYNALISSEPGPGTTGLLPTAFTPIRQASQYLFYLLQLFVVVGIIVLILKRKKSQFVPEYAAMSIGGFLLLLMSFFLPNFAASLNISRIYHLSLFLLAPFCIRGGISIFQSIASMKSRLRLLPRKLGEAKLGSVKKAWILMTAVLLVCFFLFQVGFIYKISGDQPTSIPLSMDRKNRWTIYMNQLYIDQQEVSAIKWLAHYENNELRVYASSEATTYLADYGLISQGRLYIPDPTISTETIYSSYFYLDRLNTMNNTFVGNKKVWNTTDFSPLLNLLNKIYSNGDSDIYGR